jgi:hypothetical protein
MENLPKNRQKDTHPKNARNDGKWTVLFIGAKGKVIPIKGFKAIVIVSALMLFVSLSAAVCSYFFYQREKGKNENLQSELSDKQRQVTSLRDKKDMIMARLVAAESKVTGSVNDHAIKKTSGKTAAGNTSVELKPKQMDTPKSGISETPETRGWIAIDAFRIYYDPESNTWSAQFKLINNRVNFQPISGYAFVILKPDEMNPERWRALPSIDLIRGKPSPIENGHHFDISRYKILKLETQADTDLKEFVNATVVVYEKTGELLIEKTFALQLS